MVERSIPLDMISLDMIFRALADSTRRDILKRVSKTEHSISELAKPYAMSLAAIAKHVSVLEKAGLVTKRQSGKEKLVKITPQTLQIATAHLSEYEQLWSARFDALEELLKDT
jgi:DNA-binding transcriptional ArsR family regulator